MTTLTEGRHAGEFMISESNGFYSRDAIIIASGANLDAGTVLGQVSAAGVTGAAMAGNAGSATIGALSAGAGARVGIYRATIVEPVSGLGNFVVEDPDGVTIGHGVVGTPFTGPVNFTISDGTPDAAAGDVFNITVAAGSGKYVQLNPAAVNGADQAAAILFDYAGAAAADKPAVGIMRGSEVDGQVLIWPVGISGPQKTQAIADLAKRGIIVR